MAEPLKNAFDHAFVERIAAAAAAATESPGFPTFDRDGFVAAVGRELEALELKDRINLVADQLLAALGGDYPTALPVVVEMAAIVAGAELDGETAFGETMEAWPLCSVVERHGVDHPTESLAAMETLTRAFSCEFAIRPFLDAHLERTVAALDAWTRSPIPAVRRLPSEGTRPYLPWGPKVPGLLDDPDIGIGLITKLRHDPDEVVRRSVANHLNDIARDHPDRVAAIAVEWLAEPETERSMVRHALRSLIKKGHPGAMAALGFSTDPEVDVESFTVSPADVRLGDTIELRGAIRSTAKAGSIDQRLVVDFVVHHVNHPNNARGETSSKVFKWTTIELPAGETIELYKRRLIQTASTRRYHAGTHRVELQIAGTVVGESAFELLESSE